jgi:hypothetical protein
MTTKKGNPTDSQRYLDILKNSLSSEAPQGRQGAESAIFRVLISLTIQVRAAHGQVARRNPTSLTRNLIYWQTQIVCNKNY